MKVMLDTELILTQKNKVYHLHLSEEEIADMHEKAYRLARSKYNPFSLGGSESIHDFE